MNYYVIGIGGTGAKCIEALTHLCAAGMMPGAEKMPDGTLSPPVKLYALFVDPDKANGNLERARTTLDHYVDCKQLKLGNTNFLKTEIVRPKPDVWSPFDDGSPSRLDHFFKYYDLETTHPAAAHLFDVLYSPAEKTTQLDQGFRGHPSIGAAVMAKTIQLGQDEPWKTFREQLGNDTKVSGGAKIFLFGSVFGGTGASGLPTIARLIRDEKEIAQTNLRLGGALVLPYFSFTGSTKELKASSENFLMNTKVALKYYDPQRMSGIYNAVYLFGDESPTPVDFHIGSREQKNEPHFIELYAALAAIHFFRSQNLQGYSMLARHEANQLNWNDLPDSNEGNTIKQQMGHLARCAFAYLSVYLPMLENIRTSGKGYRAPWHVDFFERKNVVINDHATQTSLEHVKSYCESFLLWLANVQTSARDKGSNLVKDNAFTETGSGEIALKPPENFTWSDFSNLILPAGTENPNALSKFWERMCDAKVKDTSAVDVGRFIHALYQESGN